VTLDGELCAFGPDGAPDFPLICERMLMRRSGIRLTYMVSYASMVRISRGSRTLRGVRNLKHSSSMASTGRHPRRSMMVTLYLMPRARTRGRRREKT
jgi:hypothetical protein